MKPTNKLRFVERIEKTDTTISYYDSSGDVISLYADKVRVLQQWWSSELDPYFESLDRGEWRDVQLEVESE